MRSVPSPSRGRLPKSLRLHAVVASICGTLFGPAAIAQQGPDAAHPPDFSELTQIGRSGNGGFQRFIFDEVDPERGNPAAIAGFQAEAQAMRARGAVPLASLHMWTNTLEESGPGGSGRHAGEPAYGAWHRWVTTRQDLLPQDFKGEIPQGFRSSSKASFPYRTGWIAPQRELAPNDPDRPTGAGSVTYGEWFNERFADYAAATGLRGVSLADHFDQVALPLKQIDFQPEVLRGFSESLGVPIPGSSTAARADHVRRELMPQWLDHWCQSYADWYGGMAEELVRVHEEAGDAPGGDDWSDQIVIAMQKHTFAHDKRYHAIDTRMIQAAMPEAARLMYHVECWSIPWNRGVGGSSLSSYMTMLGTHLSREPDMVRGAMMPSTKGPEKPASGIHGMSVFSTVDKYAEIPGVNLTEDERIELSQRVSDAAWLALPWAHLATRDGRVERAVEYVQTQLDHRLSEGLWENVSKTIYPARPLGPALYYSASIERAFEEQGNSYNPTPPVAAAARGHAIPAYFVSDAAMDGLQPEAHPSAWLVHRLDLLPDAERQKLEAVAPVFELDDLADAPLPVRFGGDGSGFAFLDQHDRTVLVCTRDRWDASAPATLTLEISHLPDGAYTMTDLVGGDDIGFEVSGGRASVEIELDRWQTRAFAVSQPGG